MPRWCSCCSAGAAVARCRWSGRAGRVASEHGARAAFPVKGVKVRLLDGQYHTVDSSEMAFRLAGSLAMREALEKASPVLLEPIMPVTIAVPEDHVGDVVGDLNSRRG